MIITCPQCATRFQADAAKFQPAGRNVRCAKCSHVWHENAPPVEGEIASDFAVIDAPTPSAEPRMVSESFSPTPSRPQMVTANAPVPSPWPARLATAAGWIGLVLIILVIGWAAVSYRQQIALLWPQSASLYDKVGLKASASGLDIADVTYQRKTENGQNVLAVAGIVSNTSARELPVPQIRVALIDDDRHELYHWNFAPAAATLHPGQSEKFLTRLTNPPSAARHFELRFAKDGE